MSPNTKKELEQKIKELEAIVSKQSRDLEKITTLHKIDIKKINNSQKALLESEAKLTEAQRVAHVGSWDLDIKTNKLSWSDETFRIFGFEKGELEDTREAFLDTIHPDDKALVFDAAKASWYNGKEFDIEHRIILPGGEVRTIQQRAEVTFDKSGQPDMMIGTVQDITERKNTEEALHESKERYSFLFSQPTIGVVYLDADGVIVDLNEAFGKILGIPYKSLIGVNTLTTLQNKEMARAIKEALKDKISIFDGEYVSITSGKKVYLHAVMQAQYDSKGIVIGGMGIFEDVTEHLKTEKALQKSDEKLQSIFRSAPIGIGLVVERKIKWVNEMFTRIIGYSADELLENNSRILYPSDEEYEKVGSKKYKQIKKYGTGTVETKFLRKDGEEIDILLSSTPLNPNDLKEGVTFTALDITSWKKAENSIKYHLDLKTAVSEASKIFISPDKIDFDKVLETIGRAVSTDRAYLFRFSYGLQTMSNTNEWCADGIKPQIDNLQNVNTDIIPWWTKKISNLETILIEDLETLPEEASAEKEFLEVQNIKALVAVPIILKDKTLWGFMGFDETKSKRKWRDYEISTLQVISNMIAKYIDRNISDKERKKLEDQLFHSQKMESIGRLAGGIAHDFNNTLTGIMGYAELLKMKFDDPNSMESEAVSVILEGTERAANLTKQLLGFARGGKYLPVTLKINDIIKETNKLTEKSFSKDIKVTFYLDPDINYVKADKSQMEQVITNLIINAKDAMPFGGHLLYESENVYLDEDFGSKYENFKAGKYVKFSVLDSGSGIPKELHKKVFEPFFTTKKIGAGVGFGLATVYGIVKNHEGYIELFSEVNEGSRFTVYLPSVENEQTSSPNIDERPFARSNGELIMIVDDEEEVRSITRLQLEHIGYKVILVPGGKKAVSIYEKRRDEIDLVLLDVIMPEMDGLETFKKLKIMNPDIKTIVMSGFSKKGKASDLLNLGAQGFVQKPFRLAELSETISNVLKK
ncbi:PAS domain S-box protein [Candidatus Latescibacterota bacterium]